MPKTPDPFRSSRPGESEAAALASLHKTLGVPAVAPSRSAAVDSVVRRDMAGLAARAKAIAPNPAPLAIAAPALPPDLPVEPAPSGRWMLPLAIVSSFGMTMCCAGSCGGLFTAAQFGMFSSDEVSDHEAVPYSPRRASTRTTTLPSPSAGGSKSPTTKGKGVEEATDANFDQAIERGDTPVFVDFYATWCGPCKVEAPLLEQMAAKYAGKVVVLKVDAEASPETAKQYGINAYPTLVEFKHGKEVKRIEGALDLSELDAEFAALIKK